MTDDTLSPGVWESIHAALARLSGHYPAEAIALADAHREEVVPHMVAQLEWLAADPSRVDDDYMLHLFAMHLLAWWRDPRGLAPLLVLVGLRDHHAVEALFGDHLTESLARCLGSMARGDLPPLMALADDRQAYHWARSAALGAMRLCVLEGDAQIDTVMSYVRDLAEREAADCRASGDQSDLLSSVALLVAELGTADMLPAIRRWFSEDLLDPGLIGLDDIEESVLQPLDQRLQELRERGLGYIGTPQEEVAWWACFTGKSPGAAPGPQASAPPPRERATGISPPRPVQPAARRSPKLGRNDPCHCGSGKKYKKCHGAG